MRSILTHIAVSGAALLILLGIPALYWTDFPGGGADTVTRASLDLPDQPSGRFVVLLNRERHGETVEQWRAFFLEEPVDVIMEDLSCMTAEGDAAGIRLAERYQARLAEHQMRLRQETGILLVSKAERGLFDAIVLSEEAAAAYRLDWNETDIALTLPTAKAGGFFPGEQLCGIPVSSTQRRERGLTGFPQAYAACATVWACPALP